MVMVSIVKVPKGRTDPDGYAERQRERKAEWRRPNSLSGIRNNCTWRTQGRGVCVRVRACVYICRGMPVPPDDGYFVHCAGDNVSAGSWSSIGGPRGQWPCNVAGKGRGRVVTPVNSRRTVERVNGARWTRDPRPGNAGTLKGRCHLRQRDQPRAVRLRRTRGIGGSRAARCSLRRTSLTHPIVRRSMSFALVHARVTHAHACMRARDGHWMRREHRTHLHTPRPRKRGGEREMGGKKGKKKKRKGENPKSQRRDSQVALGLMRNLFSFIGFPPRPFSLIGVTP